MHAELKLNDGELFPIEFNPMRFGGLGLGDLSFYAFGINPFKFFFEQQRPDWDILLATENDLSYALLVGYNNISMDKVAQQPDHEKFKKFIGETSILNY